MKANCADCDYSGCLGNKVLLYENVPLCYPCAVIQQGTHAATSREVHFVPQKYGLTEWEADYIRTHQ